MALLGPCGTGDERLEITQYASRCSREALGFFLIFAATAPLRTQPECHGSGTRHCDRFKYSQKVETGPNPVDTYRPQDLEKLASATHGPETFFPQKAGGTINLNISNGGVGTVQMNLRGLLPEET